MVVGYVRKEQAYAIQKNEEKQNHVINFLFTFFFISIFEIKVKLILLASRFIVSFEIKWHIHFIDL